MQDLVQFKVPSEPDQTYSYGHTSELGLGSYLQRPIKIHEIMWSTTTSTFDSTIDPWSLLLTDAALRKRTEGFKLLQAKLKLRIVVNGNPFLFGLGMASYYPYMNAMRGATNLVAAINCEMSMLPLVYIDPTKSSVAEMTLPFFCPDNWIELNGTTIQNMGRLRFKSINALRHTSGAMANPLQITVFAWLEDPVLSGPTQGTYGLYTIQSGDEYSRTPLSAIATSVSKAAGQLSNVPYIGPYARATSMISSVAASIAVAFGFSRPTLIDTMCRTKLVGLGNTVNTDQPEAVVKLSLDSKQELCVDPRTTGLDGTDEMAISYIVSRSALFNTSTWAPNLADGTVISRLNVNPIYYVPDTTSGSIATEIINTPISTVASMFKFWKGTIKFRFQIVASAFHRGRLRIHYEPGQISPVTIPGYNTNITRIIDLASTRDFEFVVAWNSHRGWLDTGLDRLNIPLTATHYTTAPCDMKTCNGQLVISVCNQLTTPDPSNIDPIYINMYVSAGDDFEVAAPTDYGIRNLTYMAQSGTEQDMATMIKDVSYSLPSAGHVWETSPANHVYMGESVTSIRTLLKRYCYHSVFGGFTPAQNFWWREYNFPYYPGSNLPANTQEYRHSIAGFPNDVNICANTHLNWFVPCYAGWRGGLRTKYVYPTDGTIIVRRDTHVDGNIAPEMNTLTVGTDTSSAQKMFRILASGISGTQMAKSTVDGALEIEFPFYANQRFAPARAFISTTSTDIRCHTQAHLGMLITGDAASNFGLFRFVSAGDDFSTFFWVGQPKLKFGDLAWIAPAEDELPSDDLPI